MGGRRERLAAVVLILIAGTARAEEAGEPPRGPVEVGQPVVPIVTPAARDLPDAARNPSLFDPEMPTVEAGQATRLKGEPKVDPLLRLQSVTAPRLPDGFGVPVHNYLGRTAATPPDDNADVGPDHIVQ